MFIVIKTKNFLRNIINQNLYTVSLYVRKVASAIIVFCLARYLPVDIYGLYSSYVNIVGILLLFTNFGFNEYILVSSEGNVKQVKLKLSFFMLLANLFIVSVLLISLLIPLSDKIVFSLTFLKVFFDGSFFALILTYYQATMKFKHISIVNFLYSFCLIVIALLCFKFKLSLYSFLILSVLIGFINYLYFYMTVKLNFIMVFKHWKRYIKMLDKKLFYYGLVMLSVLLYFQLPSLYVSTCLDKTSAGIYFAAFNIYSILLLISNAQVQQIMPNMIKANRTNLISLIKNNIYKISIINVIILLFFVLFGKNLIEIIYSKPEYQMSYPLLIIGAFGNLFMSAGGILACFMTAKGFQKEKFKYQVEFLFIVLLLILLLNNYCIIGATFAYCLISIYVFFRYLMFTISKIKRESFEK